MEKVRKLAIMKEVGFGNRDIGRPCLWFSAYVSEGMAALQIIEGADALKIIKESGVYDVKELNGKPCWVDDEGLTGSMHFVSIAKI